MYEWVLVVVIVIYVVYWIRIKFTRRFCRSATDLSNKTVIITGADKGIGYCTALDLARRNARVILACRNMETAGKAADTIQRETGNRKVYVRKLDVSSLASVRSFAKDFMEEESRLDVLINNAGVTGGLPYQTTEEGFEIIFATNYLGHFLLTNLLLKILKKSAPSRIVNVSSVAHTWCGQLNLENLNSELYYDKVFMYSNTKLAQILFTRHLAKLLEGSGVTVNALHPGSISTNIFTKLPQPYKFILNIVKTLFFRSPEEGAQTSICLAVSDEVTDISGQYFSECRLVKPSKHALDDDVAKMLFDLSNKYCQKTDKWI